jgi:hypothetical protein
VEAPGNCAADFALNVSDQSPPFWFRKSEVGGVQMGLDETRGFVLVAAANLDRALRRL